MIINELPRYLSEVRAFSELNPTEFNGGIKPSGKLKKVQARYLEGLFLPKKPKEDEEDAKITPNV